MKPLRPLIASVFVAGLLTGCTPIVAMTPAADANNPTCADVIVRLPDTVEGLTRRETDAQATGAWGDPTAVLLRCGVSVPTAATSVCQTVAGIDWLADDKTKGTRVFRSFGRVPAVDVVVDSNVVTPGLVLDDLSAMIGFTKPNGRHCS